MKYKPKVRLIPVVPGPSFHPITCRKAMAPSAKSHEACTGYCYFIRPSHSLETSDQLIYVCHQWFQRPDESLGMFIIDFASFFEDVFQLCFRASRVGLSLAK